MQYLGGKTRLAGDIAWLIGATKGRRAHYIEPFVGGSIFERVAPLFERAEAGDLCTDLVMLWKAMSDGWQPPEMVSEEEYRALRHAAPSPLRGFVGFGCSFGAKWFGGYARNRAGTNYAQQSAKAARRKAEAMKGCSFRNVPYWEWDQLVTAETVVYCDPPYAGTEPYKAVAPFDHSRFWRTMNEWHARGALVFVSEYSAPYPWEAVLEKKHRQTLCGLDQRPQTVERVFTRDPDDRRAVIVATEAQIGVAA